MASMPESQLPAPESPLIVDFARLEEVCMGDPDALVELADFYFAQAEREIAALATALLAGSAEEVRRLAHRLVGASAGCGMMGVLAPVRELEAQAKEGDLTRAPDLISRLGPLLGQSREEVGRWYNASKNGNL